MPSILDLPVLSTRLFFPRPDAPASVVRVSVDGAELACAARVVHQDAPWILHFHGNGETVADYVGSIADLFAARRLNAFFAEYRGYGASTGSPALVAMLADVPHLARAFGAHPARLVAYGRSIGSIYAIETVHRVPSIGALVIESGIADPLERVLVRVKPEDLGTDRAGLEREIALHLDHRAKLAGYAGRTLVLHAAHDTAIDRSHAERNASWAQHGELVIFENGDHSSVLTYNLPEIADRVAALAHAL